MGDVEIYLGEIYMRVRSAFTRQRVKCNDGSQEQGKIDLASKNISAAGS